MNGINFIKMVTLILISILGGTVLKKGLYVFLICIALFVVAGCTVEKGEEGQLDDAIETSGIAPIEVDMINREGEVTGKAFISETEKEVKIDLKMEGLTPGTKAIHIHETGLCEVPDFTSAGAHFNPKKRKHGFDNPEGFHAGDLLNIEVDENGKVNAEILAPNVTLAEGENSLLDSDGSALVIHENADDYKTDPAGNAGDRIVCGVIKK